LGVYYPFNDLNKPELNINTNSETTKENADVVLSGIKIYKS